MPSHEPNSLNICKTDHAIDIDQIAETSDIVIEEENQKVTGVLVLTEEGNYYVGSYISMHTR